MTIRITVTHTEPNSKGPIEAQILTLHPETGDPSPQGLPLTIQPGATESFYVHAHQAIVVTETVPNGIRGGKGEEAEPVANQP